MDLNLEKTKNKILEMAKNDEEARSGNPINFEKMRLVDKKNSPIIKRIIKKHGLISISKYGKEVSTAAFLLIQHLSWRSIKTTEHYLSLAEKRLNDIDAYDYAKLRDRVNSHNNQPQIYGTQIYMNKGDTEWKFRPIKNIENIDVIRSEIGLNSLCEYAKELEDDYQDKVVLPENYKSKK